MKRYRLTARAEMHGAVRDPGYVFTLGEGEVGPQRTVSQRPDGSNAAPGNAPGQLVNEPLYRELSDEESAAIDEREAAAIAEADAHAAACAARDVDVARKDDGVAIDPEARAEGNPETGEVAGDPQVKPPAE